VGEFRDRGSLARSTVDEDRNFGTREGNIDRSAGRNERAPGDDIDVAVPLSVRLG